jgi:hypothetical protein
MVDVFCRLYINLIYLPRADICFGGCLLRRDARPQHASPCSPKGVPFHRLALAVSDCGIFPNRYDLKDSFCSSGFDLPALHPLSHITSSSTRALCETGMRFLEVSLGRTNAIAHS